MFGIIVLRAIGLWAIITVVEKHAGIEQWEGMLLGFGIMMFVGTLFDLKR